MVGAAAEVAAVQAATVEGVSADERRLVRTALLTHTQREVVAFDAARAVRGVDVQPPKLMDCPLPSSVSVDARRCNMFNAADAVRKAAEGLELVSLVVASKVAHHIVT